MTTEQTITMDEVTNESNLAQEYLNLQVKHKETQIQLRQTLQKQIALRKDFNKLCEEYKEVLTKYITLLNVVQEAASKPNN